jgi:hypothetical protein
MDDHTNKAAMATHACSSAGCAGATVRRRSDANDRMVAFFRDVVYCDCLVGLCCHSAGEKLGQAEQEIEDGD